MTADTDAERIAELEEANRRLRRLLDQRDAPGELRHRLRSTLALLRAIVRRSASTERDLPGYVAHLEDRLEAVTRAQGLADQHGEVDLRTLLLDELFHYGASEGERLLLSGPDMGLPPRAGQILALAIHEVAVNAVEHGTLGTNAGRIEVSWSVVGTEPDTSLLLTWTEFGSSPNGEPARRGFGTEVLTRMLPYDLKAETDLVFGPDGLRCTLRFPLPNGVGRIGAG
jgi:two-component sensor histidine kinase